MRLLVVGGGGREHALAWKLAQSPLTQRIFCAPGNAGISEVAECIDIAVQNTDALLHFARTNRIDLTVVGPEVPLAAGIVDRFQEEGLLIFGPTATAAEVEGSKQFSKQLMRAANIPTARFWNCDTLSDASRTVRDWYSNHASERRIVIKADGLAAGKGVVVAEGQDQALEAIEQIMGARTFGASGDRVVIEEYLAGEEASIMAITDGQTVLPLVPSQDHKRIYEGDSGPNTGGMGAYTPVPAAPPAIVEEAVERVITPAVRALAGMGRPFRGVLYAGVMIDGGSVQTVEFNCRLGDPEAQTILPLLETDLVALFASAAAGRLEAVDLKWREGASVCVVAASGGYPGSYRTGLPITGLAAAAANPNAVVFHAGTRILAGETVTDGGRVLSVTGLGADIRSAAQHAYSAIEKICFERMTYRRDIGWRALGAA